jgi:hypothetical protein
MAPLTKKDIDIIENVQHRVTQMVPGLTKLAYEVRLRKHELPILASRRIRDDMIEVFKYVNEMYKCYYYAAAARNWKDGKKGAWF